jgi:peptidoglycan biosynthesis protein MviN/MurJ (putative lipid II flippase)
MYSLARMWTSFAFNVIWAAMTIVVSWLLLGQGMGARGIATAILVAYIFNCIFQFAYLNHMTGKLPAA